MDDGDEIEYSRALVQIVDEITAVPTKPAWIRRHGKDEETAALPPILPEEFVNLATQKRVTPKQACSYLYNLKIDIQKRPLSERGPDDEARQVGGRVLLWLRSQDMNVRDQLSLNHRFVGCISYFLVVEGREEFVWSWLLHELSNEKLHCFPSGRHAWVAAIMKAQRKVSGTVDLPLRTLQRALNGFQGPYLRDVVMAAARVAQMMIQDTTLAPYDPTLAEAVLSAIERAFLPGSAARKRRIAEMMLFHPTHPNARLFLDAAPAHLEVVMKTNRDAIIDAFGSNAMRAAYILRLQSADEKANWLEDLLRSRIPKVWSARSIALFHLNHDPKLEGLRRSYKGQIPPTFDHWG
ncbi:hypothetical protein CERZMDRAFT_101789 [Cercospora zeae-maydis SCOH1-5]|uniref:Uncharacterized protein n=1 Tax=Cercospora zeae-maydis SCOH1-5 TaxID=717836 RepID=A0A6A6F2R6_9PEZI|nr:hypothetical protein CERZMDRAFT_101789 [Cercospora zeae-maydis SCOH1-5]